MRPCRGGARGSPVQPRAVISEIIETCLQGKPVRSTEGKQTRDFNFVSNLIDGIILAAEKDSAIGKVINIGSGREISIRDLILTIHQLTGSSSELQFGALPIRPTEIWRMFAANDRAAKYLSWTPKISFEEGLRQTIDWYREFREIFLNSNSQLGLLAANSLDRRG